jgi:nucleotide-binding universal stress UspA family protein
MIWNDGDQDMKGILVQMADHKWTMTALHVACGYGRQLNRPIILLHLIPVPPSYLGTNYGYFFSSFEDFPLFREYLATAEDYNVPFTYQPMQYISMKDALIQAAERFDASIIFVKSPNHLFRWWTALHQNILKRRMWSQQRDLHSLDNTTSVKTVFPLKPGR